MAMNMKDGKNESGEMIWLGSREPVLTKLELSSSRLQFTILSHMAFNLLGRGEAAKAGWMFGLGLDLLSLMKDQKDKEFLECLFLTGLVLSASELMFHSNFFLSLPRADLSVRDVKVPTVIAYHHSLRAVTAYMKNDWDSALRNWERVVKTKDLDPRIKLLAFERMAKIHLMKWLTKRTFNNMYNIHAVIDVWNEQLKQCNGISAALEIRFLKFKADFYWELKKFKDAFSLLKTALLLTKQDDKLLTLARMLKRTLEQRFAELKKLETQLTESMAALQQDSELGLLLTARSSEQVPCLQGDKDLRSLILENLINEEHFDLNDDLNDVFQAYLMFLMHCVFNHPISFDCSCKTMIQDGLIASITDKNGLAGTKIESNDAKSLKTSPNFQKESIEDTEHANDMILYFVLLALEAEHLRLIKIGRQKNLFVTQKGLQFVLEKIQCLDKTRQESLMRKILHSSPFCKTCTTQPIAITLEELLCIWMFLHHDLPELKDHPIILAVNGVLMAFKDKNCLTPFHSTCYSTIDNHLRSKYGKWIRKEKTRDMCFVLERAGLLKRGFSTRGTGFYITNKGLNFLELIMIDTNMNPKRKATR